MHGSHIAYCELHSENTNQTVEQPAREVVQMYHPDRMFAAQLSQVVLIEDLKDLFSSQVKNLNFLIQLYSNDKY